MASARKEKRLSAALADAVDGPSANFDELIAAEGAYWRLYRDWAEQAAA